MNEVSLFRLYILRGMYLFIVVGLGIYLWPSILNPGRVVLHRRRCGSNALPLEWLQFFLSRSN